MDNQRDQSTADSPEIVAFASRMYDAARKGDTAIFEQALPAGLPPNMTNDKGDSLLMLSTYHGHLPLSRILLSHGADPNRLNDRGQSPLAGAVFKGEGEIVDLLLASGADVDSGKPSAAEAIVLFKKTDEYGAKFEEARERLRKKSEGGIGGTKGAFEMM